VVRCGSGSADACTCAVQAGTGVSVTGDGSVGNPYVVALAEAIATALNVSDTATVNLTKTGDGSPGNPYVISAAVIDGTVIPQTNGTLDIVGAKVVDPIRYAAGPRTFSLAISADEGNALAIGTDDGLYSGTEGGAVAPSRWQGVTVASVVDEWGFTVDFDGGASGVEAIRPANLPMPAVGQWVYVQQPPTGETYWLLIANDTRGYHWLTGTVTATSPLTVDLDNGQTGVVAVAYMPGYTPTLSDVVTVIAQGGADDNFLILGLAPTLPTP
jgi:hypothetical protein